MRRAALLALAAGACAPAQVALPADAVERATTCSAVRALELGAGRGGQAPVSFDGFTEILHFGMLAGVEDGVGVDLRRLLAVSSRAPVVMQELGEEEWRGLVEPCNAAYPETQRPAAPLPGHPYEAGLTCYGLANFLEKTAQDHPAERERLTGLAQRALRAAQPTLIERARDDGDAQRIAGGYTARAFRSGRPASLIDACERRFPA